MNIQRKLIILFILSWLGVFGFSITVLAQDGGETATTEAPANTNFIGLLHQGR